MTYHTPYHHQRAHEKPYAPRLEASNSPRKNFFSMRTLYKFSTRPIVTKNKVTSNADITIKSYIHRTCLNVAGVVSNFNERRVNTSVAANVLSIARFLSSGTSSLKKVRPTKSSVKHHK